VIRGRAFGLSYDASGRVEKAEQPFMAIPYATWANRGRGQMEVWIAAADAAARPTPYPTVATTSTLTNSPSTKRIVNVIDGDDPRSSDDPTSYFDWWPRNGCADGQTTGAQGRPCSTGEWIEMAFAKSASVSQTEIYWFDDTGHGGVRVPKSWRLLYKDAAGTWKPIEPKDAYGVAKDQYNVVHFVPVTTSALRLELVMQPNVSAGVQEWKVK
jgi:hypothetical protein